MVLKGERVSIRPIEESDTADILRWRNSRRIRDSFIYRDELTEQQHLNWLRTRVQTGKVVQFIIVINETRQPVGTIYIRDIDTENRKGEYGIYLGEESAMGKGYGKEASALLQEYAFDHLGLHRIFARVVGTNQAAVRQHRKAGFVYEGTFRDDVYVDGKFYDIIFMGLINPRERRQEP